MALPHINLLKMILVSPLLDLFRFWHVIYELHSRMYTGTCCGCCYSTVYILNRIHNILSLKVIFLSLIWLCQTPQLSEIYRKSCSSWSLRSPSWRSWRRWEERWGLCSHRSWPISRHSRSWAWVRVCGSAFGYYIQAVFVIPRSPHSSCWRFFFFLVTGQEDNVYAKRNYDKYLSALKNSGLVSVEEKAQGAAADVTVGAEGGAGAMVLLGK